MASESPRNPFSALRTFPVPYPVFYDIEDVSFDQEPPTIMAKGVFPLMPRDIAEVDVPEPFPFPNMVSLIQFAQGGSRKISELMMGIEAGHMPGSVGA